MTSIVHANMVVVGFSVAHVIKSKMTHAEKRLVIEKSILDINWRGFLKIMNAPVASASTRGRR
jgi:hypothetical protein